MIRIKFIVILAAASIFCSPSLSYAGSIYGHHNPTAYSFATHATTSSFLFTKKNFGLNYRFVKPNQFTPVSNEAATILPYQNQNVVSTVELSSTSGEQPTHNDILPFADIPKFSSEVVQNNKVRQETPLPVQPLPAATPQIEEIGNNESNSGPVLKTYDPFNRPATIHRTSYSIPSPGKVSDETNNVVAGVGVSSISTGTPSNLLAKSEPEPVKQQSIESNDIPQATNRQGLPDSSFEQHTPFFPQNQPSPQNTQANQPPQELPVPGSDNYRITFPTPPQSQPPQFTPQGPTLPPQAQPGFFPPFNRFANTPTQQQPQRYPPPPPLLQFPRNYFPPGPEPENGFNPYHLHEPPFPEPPFESEFANDPPLQDNSDISSRERSAGSFSPPTPLDFAQSTLKNVKTEELLDVARRKPVPIDCAYNTISLGPQGEDCVQVRKR